MLNIHFKDKQFIEAIRIVRFNEFPSGVWRNARTIFWHGSTIISGGFPLLYIAIGMDFPKAMRIAVEEVLFQFHNSYQSQCSPLDFDWANKVINHQSKLDYNLTTTHETAANAFAHSPS